MTAPPGASTADLPKAQLHLRLRPGRDPGEVIGLLQGASRPGVTPGRRGSFHLRIAVRDEIALAADGGMTPDTVHFDVIVDVRSTGLPADLVAVVTELGPALDPFADRERSAVVVGVERTLVPGHGRLQLYWAMRRLPELSLEAFTDHLYRVHSRFGREMPGSPGYRQLHRDHEATVVAARAGGFGVDDFDGVSELVWTDLATFRANSPTAEHTRASAEDSLGFYDRDRTRGGMAHVVVDREVAAEGLLRRP